MKKTYITILVLIIVVVGAILVFGKGKKAEAPISTTPTSQTETQKVKPAENQTGTPSLPPLSVKEFTVSGDNFSFKPSLITVAKGDRVKIIFKNDNGFHDFKIDEFGAATKQTQSPTTEILEFTAGKIGSFEYYCSVGSHRQMGMKGILKVE
jgi:plastocyanin